MSDQTPPPDQPTPTPADGLGDGHGAGATPPPPPSDSAVATAPPPPPPARSKSRAGLIIGIIAGLVVLAIIAVIAVVVVANNGEEKHSISITSTAGGMKRDKAKEAELQKELDAAELQFKTQAKNVSYVRSGVYTQDDTKRGPEGSLVFLGAKLKKIQSPTKFVSAFTKQATTNNFKAVCAYQSTGQKIAICAWATRDSMGELVPTVPGYDSKQLSKIMIDLRSDVEKTE
jgi:hypothetical protein